MRPSLRAAVLGVPFLLCVLAWIPQGGGDPVESLARAVVETDPSGLVGALGVLVPGRWSVSEASEPAAGVRRFRLECTHPSSKTSGRLAGYSTVSTSAGRRLGWMTLEPRFDPASALPRHEVLGDLAASLYDIREGVGGAPLYPSVPEFLRRLCGDGFASVPQRWELPVIASAHSRLVVATSPSVGPLFSDGFALIALQPTNDAHIAEADRFARALSGSLSKGVVLPKPRARSASPGVPFRSERSLSTGDVPLAEAVAALAPKPAAEGLAVSGLRARVRALLDGPETGEVSIILEALPEGVTLRAVLRSGSREEELLARLSPGCGEIPRGDLVWSGRLRSRAFAAYAGAVCDLSDLAFEWRPEGM